MPKIFKKNIDEEIPTYISVITIGELRRGIENILPRGDKTQATLLERWLRSIIEHYRDNILVFDEQSAQVWGKLRVPHHEHAIDKQIAATAMTHDLTLVTRNTGDYAHCSVNLLNPFSIIES